MLRSFLFLLLSFILTAVASSQIRLPSIISSGMVLQQNDSAGLWGWASPGERILVTASWNNKTDTIAANNRANWKIKIKTPAAGGPI